MTKKLYKSLLLSSITLSLYACSSIDPLEKINRTTFAFNEKVDEVALKPIAKNYKKYTPLPLKSAVNNFYSNIDDAYSFINNVLQLKPRQAAEDLIRVSINTVFGLFGLIDVASAGNMPKNNEDLGQTLGYWGVPSGPYLVVPFLGPSTIRDITAKISQGFLYGPSNIMNPNHDEYTGVFMFNSLDLLQTRADLLDITNNIEQVSLDKYNFVKSSYMQKRNYDIKDGEQEEIISE